MFRGLEIAQVRSIGALIAVFFLGISAGRLHNSPHTSGSQAPALTGNYERHSRGELVGPSEAKTPEVETLPAPMPEPVAASTPPATQLSAVIAPATTAPTTTPLATPRPTLLPKSAMRGTVSVNRATQEDLETLSLVGEKLAQRILQERAAHGAFRSADELSKRVKGIGPKIIEQNRTRLRFD
ncbi:MAG: ComEA family DNA-binding protein [Candidatus Sumerlaeota bacterium]